MRRLVTLAALGMLGTALLFSSVLAQQNASLGVEGKTDKNRQFDKIGGIFINGSGDTILVRARYSSGGKSQTEGNDLSRDRDFGALQGLLGSLNSSISTGASDSTVAFQASNLRRITVLLRPTPVSATTIRLAVSVRFHTTSAFNDSLGMFQFDERMIIGYGSRSSRDSTNSYTYADSLGDILGGVEQPSLLNAQPGEILVSWDAKRMNPSVLKDYGPYGKALVIENLGGAPFASVKVRNLSNGAVGVFTYVYGSPL